MWVAVFAAGTAMLLAPVSATAASPVLEYRLPAGGPPVAFTTEGGEVTAEMAEFKPIVHCVASHAHGEITGPRSTVSEYALTGCATQGEFPQKCKSEGAEEEEITTGPIEAELVWIDQAKDEVGELLDPNAGTYIAFECGGESAEGRGPFLAPVTPINSEASSFTATLSESASIQTPDEYESAAGELLQAIPKGKHGSHELVTTGVSSTFVVHPSVAIEITAITAQEVEAKQRAEQEAKQREQRQHEEAEAQAAANKRHEEEAAATKRHEEEARSAQQPPPTLTILKAKVVKHQLVLSLRLSAAGVVSVSGPSLRKTSKSFEAGVRRLTVVIVRAVHSSHRHTAKVKVSLRATSGTVSHTVTLKL